MSRKKIIVIGGGITGLAAAYRLHQQSQAQGLDLDIQLLDSAARLGGSLQTTTRDGFQLEGGPDCLISNKPRGVKLAEELGLGGELINTRPEFRRSFIVKGGKLHPVPEGFYLLAPAKLHPFLTSPLLSWPGKLRTLMEPLFPGRAQDEESLASFVRRRMGQEVLDWLAQPLVAGIYAADPETLSLRATFPQFIELEKKYGSVLLGLAKRDQATKSASGARYSLFVSFRNGMESLPLALQSRIPACAIRLNTAVRSLQRSESGWTLTLANGRTETADHVVLCTGAQTSARLLELQDRDLSSTLAQTPYTTSITVNMAFNANQIRHPLDGVGFVTPHLEADPAIACTFVHRKFAGRVPEGTALLRAFLGGGHQADLLNQDDAGLTAVVLKQVGTLLGISGQPLFTSVARWSNAMPQYTVGHVKRLAAIEDRSAGLPGLYLAGNWQAGVGVPDCIDSAERAVGRLVDRLVSKAAALSGPA